MDGSLIAQGARGLPVFVGTMQFSTRHIVERIAAGVTAAPEPGDIYIVNDPYLGGTHLMDVRFAMPFYRDGRLYCWLSNTGHWPDTGGAVPGGFSATCHQRRTGGAAPAAGQAVQTRRDGHRDLSDHLLQHPRVRATDRRCEGAGLGAFGGGRTVGRADGSLRRRGGDGGDCRNAPAGRKPDAGQYRADPTGGLPRHGNDRQRRGG